jgi:hypothetical protein
MAYLPSYNVDYSFFRSGNPTIDKGTYFSKRYDQPTYLTFKLVFGFNGDKEYNVNKYNYDKMPHPLFNDADQYASGAPNDDSIEYSSINYLRNANEPSRADMLKTFIAAFNDLQDNFQYYFQSVTGLDELLKVNPKSGARIADGIGLTIKCMEALDLRMSYLLNLYKKIAWDDTFQNWVLPDMMKYFTIDIYVFEFRTFHQPLSNDTPTNVYNTTGVTLPSAPKSLGSKLTSNGIFNNLAGSILAPSEPKQGSQVVLDAVNAINLNLPIWHIKCEQCEFDITSINNSGLLSELSSSDTKDTTVTFKVNVGQINEIQKYSLFSIDTNSQGSQHTVILNDKVLNGLFRKSENSSTTNLLTSTNQPEYKIDNQILGGVEGANLNSKHITGEPFYGGPGLNPNPREEKTFLGNLTKTGVNYTKNLINQQIDKAQMMPIAGLSYSQVAGFVGAKDLIGLIDLTKKAVTSIIETVKPSEKLVVEKIMDNLSIDYQLDQIKNQAQKLIDESNLSKSFQKTTVGEGIKEGVGTLQKLTDTQSSNKSVATDGSSKPKAVLDQSQSSLSTHSNITGGSVFEGTPSSLLNNKINSGKF